MATLGAFQSLGLIFSSTAKSAVSFSQIIQAAAELGLHSLTVADRVLTMADRALDESSLSDLQSFIDELKTVLSLEIKKDEVDPETIKTLEETITSLQKEHGKASIAYGKELTKEHVSFKSRFDKED